MCGIAGFASSRNAPDADLVPRMRDTLAHRGPDDAGLWCSSDSRVVLGHRRLSIIDLSRAGHQPMSDAAGDCHLVFNGEIYNFQEIRDLLETRGHRFRSTCDTEVLLEAYRAWGTDCLAKLNGMFAFALYDAPRRQLFAARDRSGEKPFFYHHADGRIVFGSELKALMADPAISRLVDPSALESYLAFGYVPHDGCMLRGVRKLPAAHALMYDVATDRLKTWSYWQLPEPASGRAVDEQALVEELEQQLFDSVRLRLVADVPVGIMLSGGVDSSLVTAMAARLTPRVKTFTISFPGHRSFDEAPFARTVAQHFGTDHMVLAAEPATVDLLPELARQYDEPLADSSMVPTALVSRLIRHHATVALGGDGGDELFGGYPHHSWVQSQARLRRLIPAITGPWLRAGMTAGLPVGFRGRNYLLGLTGDQQFALGQFNQWFDFDTRRRLLGSPAPAGCQPEVFKVSLGPPEGTPLQQTTAIDFRSFLPDDILAKVDRASMLHSLEVRAPWLDHRLVEFAFRVPDALRATGNARKILPRRLAERLLPPSLDLTRKQGFSLPLDAWFSGAWGSFTRQVLTDPGQTTFDRGTIDSLLAGQRRGRVNMHRLFALTMFELWRREYGVTVS
jgi:asparagine synthase (glutamine-hydrolysing)